MAGTLLHKGKYVLDMALGQTGSILTYRATDTRAKQPVVIQTLIPSLRYQSDFPKLQQDFLREANQLSQCPHSNLPGVIEVFSENGLAFLVLNHVSGVNLADRVQAKGAMTEADAIHRIRQVGAALRALHEHQLLHREIRPHNLICCDRTGFTVLTGFGTASGTITPANAQVDAQAAGYAAPERYLPGRVLTPATDLYGLAATLYFLLTGNPPISAPLRDRVPLPNLRQMQPSLSPTTEQAILRGMAIDATQRPLTVQDWLTLLSSSPLAQPVLNGANGARNGAVPPPVAIPAPVNPAPANPAPAATLAVAPPMASPVASPVAPATIPPPPVAAISRSKPQGWLRSLMMAGMVAAFFGGCSGIVLRLTGIASPGSAFFNTEQTFPPSKNWPGTPAPPQAEGPSRSAPASFQDAPVVSEPPPSRFRSSVEVAPPAPTPTQAVPVPIQDPSPPPEPPSATEPVPLPADPLPIDPANPAPADPAPPTQASPNPVLQPSPAPPALPPSN